MDRERGPDRRRAFGVRLRQLRQDRGLSQEVLAHRAGLSPNYVGDVERGTRNLGIENVWALADALDLNPAALFEE